MSQHQWTPTIANLPELEKIYYYIDQIKQSGALKPNQTWYLLRIEKFMDDLTEEIQQKQLPF